jgi:glycosyltransferase involved in cell wall biosynthesis
MTKNYNLSIILPIYNPHGNWEFRLNHSLTILSELLYGINFEIIIINDGSTFKIKDKIEKFLIGIP